MKDQNVEDFIKKIVEMDISNYQKEEIIFNFFKCITNNYSINIPKMTYNVFVKYFPEIKNRIKIELDNKIFDIKAEINNILVEISKFDEKVKGKINVRENKVCISSYIVKRNPVIFDTMRGIVEVKPSTKHPLIFKEITKKRVIKSDNTKKVALRLRELIDEYESKTSDELNEAFMEILLQQVQEENGERFIYEDMYNIFVIINPCFYEYFKLKNNDKELQRLKSYNKRIYELEQELKFIKEKIIYYT